MKSKALMMRRSIAYCHLHWPTPIIWGGIDRAFSDYWLVSCLFLLLLVFVCDYTNLHAYTTCIGYALH